MRKVMTLLLEEELYDKAQGKFEGVEGYGTEKNGVLKVAIGLGCIGIV